MDYFMLKEDGLLENSRIPIVSLGTAGEVFYEMALDMIDHIKANNSGGEISASFPVTLAQNHPDARITITSNVAEAAY